MEKENNSQKGRIIAILGAIILVLILALLFGLKGCERKDNTGVTTPTPTEAAAPTTDENAPNTNEALTETEDPLTTAPATESTVTDAITETDELSTETTSNTEAETGTVTEGTKTEAPLTTEATAPSESPDTEESTTPAATPTGSTGTQGTPSPTADVTAAPTQTTGIPSTVAPTQATAISTPVPTKAASAEAPAPTKKPAATTPEPTKKPATSTPIPTKKPATSTPVPTKKPATSTPIPTKKPATPTYTPTATPTPTSFVVNTWNITGAKIPSSTAQAFVNKMGVGWNLGNAYDSSDCTWLGDKLHNSGDSWFGGSQEKQYRYAWCQKDWSNTLIDKLYAEGFRTIRIPVSWHNHCDENYIISSYWMSDVKRVVDYCYNKGMYVILNVHHDNNTERGYYPTEQYREMSEAYLETVWTQIAKEFNGYGERLVFELLNEPRLVGASNEWWPYSNSTSFKTTLSIIRDYQQVALNAIRATGGNNNSIRYILATGYAASWYGLTKTGTGISYLPKDSINGHLLLSAHCYDPNEFALNAHKTGDINFTSTEKNSITDACKSLYNTYVSQGIPVVMTEFGAVDNDNTQARMDYYGYFIATARAYGISCVCWDNNSFGARNLQSETYGLINRGTKEWAFKNIADAMLANN